MWECQFVEHWTKHAFYRHVLGCGWLWTAAIWQWLKMGSLKKGKAKAKAPLGCPKLCYVSHCAEHMLPPAWDKTRGTWGNLATKVSLNVDDSSQKSVSRCFKSSIFCFRNAESPNAPWQALRANHHIITVSGMRHCAANQGFTLFYCKRLV